MVMVNESSVLNRGSQIMPAANAAVDSNGPVLLGEYIDLRSIERGSSRSTNCFRF